MEATAQLNIRLDPELKKAGDRALAELGLPPSQAIRTLYRNLTSGGDRAKGAQRAIIEPNSREQERRAEAERKLKQHREFQTDLKKRYLDLGIPYGASRPAGWPSDDELLFAARMEHAQERERS